MRNLGFGVKNLGFRSSPYYYVSLTVRNQRQNRQLYDYYYAFLAKDIVLQLFAERLLSKGKTISER